MRPRAGSRRRAPRGRRAAPRIARAIAVSAWLALAPAGARGEGLFTDPVDGAFDLDRWLASRYGFIPLLVPVTEPAVGYGLAGAVFFLHGKLAEAPPDAEERPVPPSVSGVVGMITSNGSWAAGAGHLGHWRAGDLRYLGAAAYASLELTAYLAADARVRFRIDAVPMIQELTVRLGRTDLTAGGRYTLIASRLLMHDDGAGAVDARDLRSFLSGLGPVLRWDGRDSIFSPSRGVRVEAAATWYAPWLGSDRNGWRARVAEVSYARITAWLVGSVRLDLQLSGGDLPFWYRPFVELRGVPALRYQGRYVFVAETEERIDFTRRWSGVAFGGAGVAAATWQATLAWNGGGGFRYLLARRFGVRAGLDVARGPEDWAVYVILGNAWR